MGVYHNYYPLGVDSTPNLRMGAQMHSLASFPFLLLSFATRLDEIMWHLPLEAIRFSFYIVSFGNAMFFSVLVQCR